MRKAMKAAITALVCFALLFSSTRSNALEIGTDVSITVDRLITSKTEDCTLNVGATQLLTVDVSSPVQTYLWEVSTDGGTSWTQVGSSATYTITNAQSNTPENMPYQYRVTVTTGTGATDSAIIRVLVSDDYDYRKISLRNGDTDVSAYMHSETRLVVTPMPEGSPDAIALEANLSAGCLALILCDISLVNQNDQVVPYFGALQVDFHVGSAYDGQTLKVYHLLGGHVVSYSGAVSGGVLSIIVNSLSPFMVEAAAASIYTIRASAGAGGSVVPSGRVNVASGADKTFTFLPDAGYQIAEVLVNGVQTSITGNSYTFANVSADATLSVRFAAVTPGDTLHTVTVSCGAHGSVSPGGAVLVRHGSPMTFYFHPEDGYALDTVTVDGVPVNAVGSSFTLSAVTADMRVEATFRASSSQPPNVYFVISAYAGSNGSISPSGDVRVEFGGSMYFYCIPDAGYVVDTVTVNGAPATLTGGAYAFVNVTCAQTIEVTFIPGAPPPPVHYTISASAGENGSISPSGDILVVAGGVQTFYFIPNSGYAVDGVYVDGVQIAGRPYQYFFSDVRADHTLRVTFRRTATPPTGDSDSKLLWTLLIVASLLLAFFCLLYWSRLKKPAEPGAKAVSEPQNDARE